MSDARVDEKRVRVAWADAAKALAAAGDDALVWPELSTEDDSDLEW